MTRVSVLIPVRSPAPWLDDTLAGLLSQTISDWELVVVVHGDDAGLEAQVHSRVATGRVLAAPVEWTLPQVLNHGLAACTGEVVARLDADDIPEPARLARQVEYLRDHPDVVLVCTPVALVDESGAALGREVGPTDEAQLIRGMRWKCVIQHPSVMFRRQAVLELGGYDPRARHVEDYELWLRLAGRGRLGLLAEPLTRYRVHPAQVTRTTVIGRPARELVGSARRAWARQRGESVLMARVRQAVWAGRQVLREVGTRTH